MATASASDTSPQQQPLQPQPTPAPLRAPGQSLASDPAYVKLTRGYSCLLCQTRKVRCDKNKPCGNCVKAGVECRVVPPQPPRRRKKKPQERDLVDRLKKYELLLAQNGVKFDPIGNDLRKESGNGDDIDEIENGIQGLNTSPSASGLGPGVNPDKPNRWFPFNNDYRNTEHLLRDADDTSESEDDGAAGPTMHQAFDTMFGNTDGFPFVIGGTMSSVTAYHPAGMQAFQLWQIYLNNVHPMLKLMHAPTLQGQLIEASADTSKVSRSFEALMFSIYLIAVVSMKDEDVEKKFGQPKNTLLTRYHHGTQQSLVNAGFMRSPDLVTLQAYLQYLIAVRQYIDPRSMFCLLGIAVRIAQRLGLHRDAAAFGLPPFEVELRRRLWWQLAIFDKRLAEITGAPLTALWSSNADCKWPLNINDTDLHMHAKDAPLPHVGATEMMYVLLRFELSCAAHPDSMGTSPNLSDMRLQFSPSPTSPDLVTHMANTGLPAGGLDNFAHCLEGAYFRYCDPKIPLHLFALLAGRGHILKLRIIDYLVKEGRRGPPRPPSANDAAQRADMMRNAIRTLELDNETQSAEALQGFQWHTNMHFPFPAYLFMAGELRFVTTGKLSEQAWAIMGANHELRGLGQVMRSPMHIALSRLLLRAWAARVAAEAHHGRVPAEPSIITMLKGQHVKRLPRHEKSTAKEKEGSSPGTVGTRADSLTSASTPQTVSETTGAETIVPNMAPAMPSNMNGMEANGAYPVYDTSNAAMFGSGIPGDVDFGEMDWTSLLQGFAPQGISQQAFNGWNGQGLDQQQSFGNPYMATNAMFRPGPP